MAAFADATQPFTLGLIDASLLDASPAETANRLIVLAPGASGQTDAEKWLRLGLAAVLPQVSRSSRTAPPSGYRPLLPRPRHPTAGRTQTPPFLRSPHPPRRGQASQPHSRNPYFCGNSAATWTLPPTVSPPSPWPKSSPTTSSSWIARCRRWTASTLLPPTAPAPPANALLGDRERCLAAGINPFTSLASNEPSPLGLCRPPTKRERQQAEQ